jgi:hypothetical protein
MTVCRFVDRDATTWIFVDLIEGQALKGAHMPDVDDYPPYLIPNGGFTSIFLDNMHLDRHRFMVIEE